MLCEFKRLFIISHYENVYIINIMTIKVNRILVDFDPYTETSNIVTRKCYRCKQVKNIDCFKRCYCVGKHSYCYVKYIATCSECLDKSSLKG